MKIKAKDLIAELKYSEALDILNKALDTFPRDYIALNFRSQVYLALNELKLGYTDAKRSCKINETCGESFFQLGEAFAALNRFDDAVQAFNTCLELEPEDGELNTKVCDSLDQLLTRSPGQEIEVSEDEGGESSKENDIRGDCTVEDQDGPSNKESSHLDPCQNVSPQELKFTCDNGKEIASCDVEKINLDLATCDKEDEKYLLEEKQKTATEDNCRDLTVEKQCTIPSSTKSDKPCSSSSIKRSHSLSPEPTKISRVVEKKAKIGKETTEPQLDDFECKLCFFILFHPVTTACGHVFCRNCLETCIDYNPACPICRRNISFNETTGVGNVTEVIQRAIEYYFPDEIEERKNKHEEHMSLMARVGEDEDVPVPIFDCTLAFPTIQCPLHIFEPRYRKMFRECMQSGSKKFGMCQSNNEGDHIDFGTVMEVRHVRYLPDGRSVIDTVGGRRFKVVGKSKKNGISYGKVEYFDDDTSLYRSEIACEQLINKCKATYDTLSTYIGNLHPSERECITNALGPIPLEQPDALDSPNGESWVWWAASALPLNDKAKLMMFKSQSLGDRVTIIQRFLNVLSRVRQNRQVPAS
eukprot:gene7540-13323_t